MDIALTLALIMAGTTCLIALIVHKSTGSSHSRRVALFAALAILVTLGVRGARSFSNALHPEGTAGTRHEREFMRMGGFYLGQYLQYAAHADERDKVLVLDFPEDFSLVGGEYSRDVIDGLRDGLASHGLLAIAAIEHPHSANRSRSWLTAAEFDRIVKAHPEAGIVVTLVGLPADPENVTLWADETPPRLVIFGGNLENLQEAIRRRFVLAAVTFVPGVRLGGRRPPDPQRLESEFFDRFLLVTPENLDMTMEIFPGLFK